ncbi:tyrosine-type recombinase/integrase [Streptomyces sp. NPDC055103]
MEKFAKDLHVSGAGLSVSTVNDRMVVVAAMLEAAVADKRIPDNPARGVRISRAGLCAVDEDEIPTLGEVDLIAAHIAPRYRLAVYLQSGTGQRTSEVLAISAGCLRSGFVRIRWQVSAKAHTAATATRSSCRSSTGRRVSTGTSRPPRSSSRRSTPTCRGGSRFLWPSPTGGGQATPAGGLLRPAPARQGRDAHRLHLRLPLQEGMRVGGPGRCGRQAKYTPGSLRHFFASIALANGVPIREVSRWLGHKSIKTTVDIYGHLVPNAWDRCRDIMQNAMRPAIEGVEGPRSAA